MPGTGNATPQTRNTPTEKTIERRIRIAAPRAQVFRALMDPGTLSRWLFAAVRMGPDEGASFSFEWRDTTVPASAQGEILELIPDTRLILSWYMEADGVTSEAAFDLSDADGGTELRFVHRGLPQEPEWIPRFQNVALEWDKVLLNLRFLLEERGEGKHLFYFRTQRVLLAPVERVYHAWITLPGLGSWLARDPFAIVEEGAELSGTTLDTGRLLEASFQRIEPHRHLRFLWAEGGVRGLIGVSFWPSKEGTLVTLTLRSFALLEMERPFIQLLWDKRFQRLEEALTREPATPPEAMRAAAGVRASTGTAAGGAETGAAGAIRASRRFEAPPQRVWNALTDAAILRRWFLDWTDFEPRVDSSFTFLWDHYGEVRGRVLEVRPGEALALSCDLPGLPEPTELRFRMSPAPDQAAESVVEVEHGGWGTGPAWDRERTAHESGWPILLAYLDFFLRKGAGREKRGFFIRRRLPVAQDHAARLFTADGLRSWAATGAAVDRSPGGKIEITFQDGSAYRGTVVAAHPSGEGAAELAEPESAMLEWGFAADPEGSRIGIALRTYAASGEWIEAERRRWAAAIDTITGE